MAFATVINRRAGWRGLRRGFAVWPACSIAAGNERSHVQ